MLNLMCNSHVNNHTACDLWVTVLHSFFFVFLHRLEYIQIEDANAACECAICLNKN